MRIKLLTLSVALFCVAFQAQTGNVGINTTSPTETLDINGTLRVRTIPQLSASPANSILVFDSNGEVKSSTATKIVEQAAQGSAAVSTNSTLSGNGTTSSPLKIAQQGASNGQVLGWNGTSWVPQTAASLTTTNTISSSGNTITSNVNGVSSTAPSINSNTLTLTGNNLSTAVNGVASSNVSLAAYLDNTDNQTLSISANSLSISGGNSVTLPSADGSETKISAGTNISVTGSGTSASPYVVNSTFTEVDGSTTNEIQTLSKTGNTISLSLSGGSVTVTDGTVTNVTGTAPIVVTNNTTTPAISLTRNNLATGTSSATATAAATITNGTNAVVNGADTSITVNNTAPLWNANQLQGKDISTTAPTNNQVLRWNGTSWAPGTQGDVNTTITNTIATGNRIATYTSENSTATDIKETITNLSQNTTTGVITYTKEDTTTATAKVVSADANNAIKVGSDGGAYRELNYIDVYNSNATGVTVTAGSPTAVMPINTIRTIKGTALSLGTNEVIINTAGDYKIFYSGGSSTVTEYSRIDLRKGTTIINNTGVFFYGTSNGRTVILTLAAGDKISLLVTRTATSGSVTMTPEATSLVIDKLN